MDINPQARELNETLRAANPAVGALLSRKGQAIFFPKKGILAQTAEAASASINATIGAALEDDGSTMCFDVLAQKIALDPADVFPYAGGFGKPALRKKWKTMMVEKNPALKECEISDPIVTSALTHGLQLSGYLLVDPGDTVILPHLFWGNYRLVLSNGFGARLHTFPTFTPEGNFNCEGLRAALSRGEKGKRIVLLNFPNNPTGYTPTEREGVTLRDIVCECAGQGNHCAVIVDDAYFGLVYKEGIFTQSMFSLLAAAHENVLAVKLDGPTKEDYVWGFRVGFLTFGVKGGTRQLYAALEQKCAGMVRSTISNASHLGQSLLLQAYNEPAYAGQKREKYAVLKRRYTTIQNILAQHEEYAGSFRPLPFNSGYFMCLQVENADAEKVRTILLEKYSTGVIAISDAVIRVAFSSTPHDHLPQLFENVHKAVQECRV